LKIRGKMKYEAGREGLSKVLRKIGTLTPKRTIYTEIKIRSTTSGVKKDNSGYARRINPRFGIRCNW
jgi:hypothetical protein